MNVAVNGKFFGSNPTGVQRVAFQLIKALDRGASHGRIHLGERPEIICPRDAGPVPDYQTLALRRGGLFTWQPWEQLDLPRLARGRLLLNLCNLAPLGVATQATMIHDAQVFLSPQSYSRSFAAWYRFALPHIGRTSAKILTVSHYSKAMLDRFKVAPADKIEVIYNGVDHMAAVVADRSIVKAFDLGARPFVVCIAALQAHKNLKVLCQAFAAPRLADFQLVLVGGATRTDLKALGIEAPATTVFVGRVSDEQLRGLMDSALAFACPSTTEGFGLPPLEAMSVGCPAVVAPCGALPEVCGAAALYAAPDDPEAWADAILKLAEDSGYRARASAWGRAHAAQFRWDRAAARLGEVIGAML